MFAVAFGGFFPVKTARRLVIDIGTNSVLALLADVSGRNLKVISDKQVTTRLGERLGESGRLSGLAMKRTIAAVDEFVRSREHDSATLIGTEAFRAALNSDDFINLVFEITGKHVIVISGEQEAELNYFGALYGMPAEWERIAVLDVGGGSSEFVIGDSDRIFEARSLPVGASTLHEISKQDGLEFYASLATKIIEKYSGGFASQSFDVFLATGGTIASIAALDSGLSEYDAAAVHNYPLTSAKIEKIALGFERVASKDRRNLIAFDPERADLILPGAGIILAFMSIIKEDRLLVSTGGLRYGAALRPDLLAAGDDR